MPARASLTRLGRPGRRALLIGALVLIALVAAAVAVRVWSAPDPTAMAVVKVVDGDTLDLRDSQGEVHRVRLVGIDAPESAHGGEAAACGADAATARLTALLASGPVEFTPDSVGVRVDRYGRDLGYVSAGRRDVAEALVAEGYVEAWYPEGAERPSRYPSYRLLEQRAHVQKWGSWATCERLGR